MGSTPRNLPRFLPVLTEVVDLPQLAPIPAAAAPAPDEMAGTVMPVTADLPEGGLSEETRALVSRLVDEQLQFFRTQMLQELESAVRHAVAEAVAPH